MESYAFLVLFAVLSLVSSAEASRGFDFGDLLATVLGVFIAVVGILACLGLYARNSSAPSDLI